MIKLDENYRIVCDVYNYTLVQEEKTGNISKKSNKEEVTKNQWYYPTLKDALNKYVNQTLKISNSVLELMDRLDVIENKIINLKIEV